jgi:hypothetical protein
MMDRMKKKCRRMKEECGMKEKLLFIHPSSFCISYPDNPVHPVNFLLPV